MNLFRGILALIFFTALVFNARAQDDCELNLNDALQEFNAGHFSSIPELLKNCLDKNQSRDWQQRAYLLLAETYLLLEDPLAAENSYLKVLKANPEYRTQRQRDPIDLVYLSSKFTATPIFSLYGSFGSNVTSVRVIHDVRIESFEKDTYAMKIGWQLRGGLTWNYNDRIALAAEFNYHAMAYQLTTTPIFGRDVSTLSSRQNWFSVPLLVNYSDDIGIFRPYGYCGYSANFLFNEVGTIRYDNVNVGVDDDISEGGSAKIDNSERLGFTDSRQRFNHAIVVGAGLKYKIKVNYFFVDFRYAMGLNNVVDPNKRYQPSLYDRPLVTDDFRVDNLSISVGYIKPLYKPRKLKKARSKSVLRKINKADESSM